MEKRILLVSLVVVGLAAVYAQVPPGSPDEVVGTIVEFAPGASMVVKPDAGNPVQFGFARSVTIVNANGKEIPIYKLKRGRKVRVHYSKQGNDLLADKIALVQD